jgi:hypothetical protein
LATIHSHTCQLQGTKDFGSRLPLPWGWFAVLLIALTIWGLLDVRRRGYFNPENPGEHMSDFTVYTEAGAAFFDGRPPYEVTNPRGWCYLYPPMFALVVAPLHVLPMQDQVTVWFFLSLLMCWGCFRECQRILRGISQESVQSVSTGVLEGQLTHIEGKPEDKSNYRMRWFPWLGWMTVAAAALPTLNCLQRGQVGVLKLYLLLLGVRLILAGRCNRAWLFGGMVLAMPIVMKIIPVVPVGTFLFVLLVAAARLHWPMRRLFISLSGLALGFLLFILLIPAALIGWNSNLTHLRAWSDFMLVKADDGGIDPRSGNSHSLRNQSMQNALYRLGNYASHTLAEGPDDRLVENDNPPPMVMDRPGAQVLLEVLRGCVLLALLLTAVRLGCRGDPLSLAVGFALGCAAMLVASPIARGHYFMLLAPGVLLLPLWLDRRGMAREAAMMATAPAILLFLHYILLYQVGRIGLLGLGTTGWLIAAMILVCRATANERATVMVYFSRQRVIL